MVMAMLWNNGKSLEEHVKRIASLRKSPASDPESTAGLLNSMPTLYAIGPMEETGGSRHVINTAGWSAPIPMWKIAIKRISPN